MLNYQETSRTIEKTLESYKKILDEQKNDKHTVHINLNFYILIFMAILAFARRAWTYCM